MSLNNFSTLYRKTYGHIPGVPVGTWWATRAECSLAAVHALVNISHIQRVLLHNNPKTRFNSPYVAGISGDKETGAHSIALSGGTHAFYHYIYGSLSLI